MIRKVISEKLNITWSEIKLQRTEKGKPVLDYPSDKEIAFNIAHQGDYAVLASEFGRMVGIDVMKVERPSKYFKKCLLHIHAINIYTYVYI